MTSWRIATDEEVRAEYPRLSSSYLVAAVLTNDEGEPFVDAFFVVFDDGVISLPHMELDVDDLLNLVTTLMQRANEIRAERAASSGETPLLPAPTTPA
jgi:hypothetical protein